MTDYGYKEGPGRAGLEFWKALVDLEDAAELVRKAADALSAFPQERGMHGKYDAALMARQLVEQVEHLARTVAAVARSQKGV